MDLFILQTDFLVPIGFEGIASKNRDGYKPLVANIFSVTHSECQKIRTKLFSLQYVRWMFDVRVTSRNKCVFGCWRTKQCWTNKDSDPKPPQLTIGFTRDNTVALPSCTEWSTRIILVKSCLSSLAHMKPQEIDRLKKYQRKNCKDGNGTRSAENVTVWLYHASTVCLIKCD